jgi:hypothetical protein
MSGPPEPETRNRPGANRTEFRKGFIEPDHTTEPTAEFQARSLRRHFAVGYSLAASLAPLIWGMPR